MAYKQSPKQCDKDVVTLNQVVCFISCQGFCTHNEWPYLEFQLTATNFISMAAKLSHLGDETSGANLQTEGHVDMPSQNAKELWEPEASDSSPSNLPSWSPAWRLLSSGPNTKYCLEICVTLMEELRAVPPPSHSWIATLVEHILWNARTGLTKTVMIGPGRPVLFYRRCSMGKVLTTDESRDAAFLPHRSWYVGRNIGLPCCRSNDDSRGKKGHCSRHIKLSSEGKGPGCPHVNPLAQ